MFHSSRNTQPRCLGRGLAPLLYVVPAYAVLVLKGGANCEGPRALDAPWKMGERNKTK